MKIFVTLAVFDGCPRAWLDDAAAVRAALERAVEAGRFTLLEIVARPFSPHGVTACAVVGESHLALHTWPEEGRMFVDVASCSSREGVRRALDAIGAALPEGRLALLEERDLDPEPRRPA
jgi:S-adenosylmethionine decarboxylase